MAKIKINHINYILPGDKETLINMDVEYHDQFNDNQDSKVMKNMTFAIDTENDSYDINVKPFTEVSADIFNNRHAMLYGQTGKTTITDLKNQEGLRAQNLGRAIYDIKDVALKSAVASRIIDPSDKEKADVDDGFIEIYGPHLREDPIGFCQVKNYSYGISKQVKVGPVLHQTTIKKTLLNESSKSKETKTNSEEFEAETVSNDKISAKQSYSYYLNPRDVIEPDDFTQDYELEIPNGLPTYTYVPLSALTIPYKFCATLEDIIGTKLSSLLSGVLQGFGDPIITSNSPLVGPNRSEYKQYILSAERVVNGESFMISASFPLTTILSPGGLRPPKDGKYIDLEYAMFSRSPSSYYQYITAFGALSNDVLSTLLIPKYNSLGMGHNYIYEVPLTKNKYNKYDIGLVQGDMLVGKNAFDVLYNTNISATNDWHQSRDYINIGSKGGKIFLTYYDDAEYGIKGASPGKTVEPYETTEGLPSQYDSKMPRDMETHLMEKVDKSESTGQLRTYQKVEVLDVINRFLTETKHKANIFNVNVNGLKTILDNVDEDDTEKLEKVARLKNDIKNSIRNVVSKLIPAHTQLFDVTFREESKLQC